MLTSTSPRLPDCCGDIVVSATTGTVDAALDDHTAGGEPWAFGIVRRLVELGPDASAYLDGFGRVRRLRVRLGASSGWIEQLARRCDLTTDEAGTAQIVAALAQTVRPGDVQLDLSARDRARPLAGRGLGGPATGRLGMAAEPVSLAGKVALVTGASRGIGPALARRLASAGAAVAVTARTLDGRGARFQSFADSTLADTVDAIRSRGGVVEPVLGDLTDPAATAQIHDEVVARLGAVDIIVNNAARGVYMPLESWSDDAVAKMFQANVMSPFALVRHALPAMRAKGAGWVVNISSIVADHPIGPPFGAFEHGSYTTVYGMTKAALDRSSTGMAIETHADGISINSLSPSGGVRTPGALAATEMFNSFPEFAEPVETMAEAVLALCEARAEPITGGIFTSGALLADLGREVRSLDGEPFVDEAVLDLDLERAERRPADRTRTDQHGRRLTAVS